MATTSNTADGRGRVTVRPAGVPAYYLGRPAHVWMAVFRPRPRRGSAASVAGDPEGHDKSSEALVA